MARKSVRQLVRKRSWEVSSVLGTKFGSSSIGLFYSSAVLAIFVWQLLASGIGFAETLYKYTDKDGVLHFTDRNPQTDRSVTSYEAFIVEPRPKVFVESVKEGGTSRLNIVNDYPLPVEVEIYFTDRENIVSDPELPKRFVVAAQSRRTAVHIRSKKAEVGWQYRYHYRFMLGTPDARHQPEGPYRLPFEAKRSFTISQGFNGGFSHQEAHSRYAVDIAMPIGTPVLCARGGRVVAVEHSYAWAGIDREEYIKKANFIRILHSDGTMGLYAHLKKESASVKSGDTVTAGQVIAESGNTGYSSGPHLHFVVQKNQDMNLVSVPFQFAMPDGRSFKPTQGMAVGAP